MDVRLRGGGHHPLHSAQASRRMAREAPRFSPRSGMITNHNPTAAATLDLFSRRFLSIPLHRWLLLAGGVACGLFGLQLLFYCFAYHPHPAAVSPLPFLSTYSSSAFSAPRSLSVVIPLLQDRYDDDDAAADRLLSRLARTLASLLLSDSSSDDHKEDPSGVWMLQEVVLVVPPPSPLLSFPEEEEEEKEEEEEQEGVEDKVARRLSLLLQKARRTSNKQTTTLTLNKTGQLQLHVLPLPPRVEEGKGDQRQRRHRRWSRAVEEGILATASSWTLVLSEHVVVRERSWLSQAMTRARHGEREAREELGMVACKIVYGSNNHEAEEDEEAKQEQLLHSCGMDEVKTMLEQEETIRTEEERKQQVNWPYLRLAGERRTHALANSNSKAMFTDVAAPSPHCFFANAASARRFFNDSAASASSIQSIVPFLRMMEWSKFAHQKHSQRAVYVPTEAAVELRAFDTIIGLEDVETFFSPSIFRTSELLYQLSPMVTKNDLWDIILQKQKEEDQVDHEDNKAEQAIDLVWDSYGGCTGWGLESAQFATQLEDKLRSVSIVADGRSFCKGFTLHARESLERLRLRMNLHISEEDEDEYEEERAGSDQDSSFVWVSHKPPPSYPQFPYRGLVTVSKRPDIVIGRSMIETNSIPDEWVDICNDDSRVTEIWVPSSFLVDVFSSAGVRRDKLHVIPVPIDTHLFDPNAFPSRPSPPLPRPSSIHNNQNNRPFIFLSVFKMEERKGWDLLLRAFWDEFRNDPPGRVELHLQTYLYPTPPPPLLPRDESSILTFISFSFPQEIHQMYQRKLPPVRILSKEQKVSEMPKLFLSADAFVLPTRGEGFGMPIVEAMAMELPVIATNWSGPSDFLTEANSYPLRVEKMESAEFFENGGGGQWAKPDVKHLQRLMRRVVEEQETGEAQRKGKRAREDVVERFGAERVAEMVQRRLVWLHHQKKQKQKV